jgi:predicted negative regulator of RcsB-dependent stress response
VGAKKIKVAKKAASKTSVLPEQTQIELIKTWANKNFGLIIGASAAIVFLILAIWGVGSFDKSKQMKAQADYATLVSQFPSQGKATQADWEKLIPELQKFVSDHKGTGSAVDAQIELAKAFFQTKRYDEAIKTASEALSAVPKGLKPFVHYQLAYAYQASGNLDKAADEWTTVKKSGIIDFEREADWNLGSIYVGKKDFAKAVEMFQLSSKAPGEYPPAALIEQELANAKSQVTQ